MPHAERAKVTGEEEGRSRHSGAGLRKAPQARTRRTQLWERAGGGGLVGSGQSGGWVYFIVFCAGDTISPGETKGLQPWRPAPLGGRFAPRTQRPSEAGASSHSGPGARRMSGPLWPPHPPLLTAQLGRAPSKFRAEELGINELRAVPSADQLPPSHPLGPPDPGHPFVVQPRGTRLPAGNEFWVWPGRRKRMRGFNPREQLREG